MAMQKRIGDGEVRAKFAFIAIDPVKFNEKELYFILRNVCTFEEERISEREITEFIVFVEDGKRGTNPKPRAITNEFQIDGKVLLTNQEVVQATIEEKQFHKSPAFRKAGQKSTHPPRWLLTTTLVIVIGSPRFLMDNVDLYLEREGLLRDPTFELIKEVGTVPLTTFELVKEVGTLAPGLKSKDNYVSVDIAHKSFYRGYVEQLGQMAGIRPKDEDRVFTTRELSAFLETAEED